MKSSAIGRQKNVNLILSDQPLQGLDMITWIGFVIVFDQFNLLADTINH